MSQMGKSFRGKACPTGTPVKGSRNSIYYTARLYREEHKKICAANGHPRHDNFGKGIAVARNEFGYEKLKSTLNPLSL